MPYRGTIVQIDYGKLPSEYERQSLEEIGVTHESPYAIVDDLSPCVYVTVSGERGEKQVSISDDCVTPLNNQEAYSNAVALMKEKDSFVFPKCALFYRTAEEIERNQTNVEFTRELEILLYDLQHGNVTMLDQLVRRIHAFLINTGNRYNTK